MEKTILEWFLEAKEQGYEWADLAITNTSCNANVKRQNLSSALAGAFFWEVSHEGHVYWQAVYDGLKIENK